MLYITLYNIVVYFPNQIYKRKFDGINQSNPRTPSF